MKLFFLHSIICLKSLPFKVAAIGINRMTGLRLMIRKPSAKLLAFGNEVAKE